MLNTPLLYFAYGSNLLDARQVRRTPSARFLAVGNLSGHKLCFHKKGMDDSGKCDALQTGQSAHVVMGVVYRLSETDKRRLDRFEGPGYEVRQVEVTSTVGRLLCFGYFAKPHAIDPQQRPYDWYHALVLAGAREREFPPSYIQDIEQVGAKKDPNEERRSEHLSLLPRYFQF